MCQTPRCTRGSPESPPPRWSTTRKVGALRLPVGPEMDVAKIVIAHRLRKVDGYYFLSTGHHDFFNRSGQFRASSRPILTLLASTISDASPDSRLSRNSRDFVQLFQPRRWYIQSIFIVRLLSSIHIYRRIEERSSIQPTHDQRTVVTTEPEAI
jgi:hypothetical protein